MCTAHTFIALALLAASLTPALAQQPVSSAQVSAPAASAPKPPPPPPMINRWVDTSGQVHYGDKPPHNPSVPIQQVGPVEVSTPEQKAQAHAQLKQDRDDLEQSYSNNVCAEQWTQYNATADCGTYRAARCGRSMRQRRNHPYVCQHCPEVPQPQCPQPSP